MTEPGRSLNEQVVVITGGAGGIGRVTARALARSGAKVAIGDLDHAAAKVVADSLGPGHIGGRLDVTDMDSFEAFIERAESELGPVATLINNAGVMLLGPLDEETDEAMETMISVNLTGVINGTKIAMRRMKPRGQGRIVNIASQAGKIGFPGGATYCATKFAVVGLCEAVRNELHGTGVGVTCVMPAVVQTELGAGVGQTPGVEPLEPEAVARAIVQAIMLGEPEVWLPRLMPFLQKPVSMLPPAGRDFVLRSLKADRVLLDVDEARREGYEQGAVNRN